MLHHHARLVFPVLVLGVFLVAPSADLRSQSATAGDIPGIRNYTKVDATFACGGAPTLEAFAALKQAGYKSVVNLRAVSEAGANVEEEKRAATAAGLAYLHIPFVSAAPDPARVDEFLAAVVRPDYQPMLLHCASGGRASIFWAIKRVMVDGWSVDKALAELPDLVKNVQQPLRAFALDYLKSHGKTRP